MRARSEACANQLKDLDIIAIIGTTFIRATIIGGPTISVGRSIGERIGSTIVIFLIGLAPEHQSGCQNKG